jgi:uncharacterized protein YbcC (UPF0753/DUF2309 family)
MANSKLHHLLHHLAHFLPAQGPIGVFIHHNTLHAFQYLPFETAVREAATLFHTEPYWTEELYRDAMNRKRIRAEDIYAVLSREPGSEVTPGLHRRELRFSLLLPGIRTFDAASISWRIEDGDLASDFRSPHNKALFDAVLARTEHAAEPPESTLRPIDDLIHPWLIRLSAAFLDQGLSYWPMPGRELGFYAGVRRLMAQPAALLPPALAGVEHLFRQQLERNLDAEGVVLEFLGPDPSGWEKLLSSELLALPGWAGLFAQLEANPALFPHDPVPCSLLDFLAVRLTLVAAASEHLEAEPPSASDDPENVRLARAATLYDAARLLRLNAATIAAWPATAWSRFVAEVEAFDPLERRRLYHLAYERWHEQHVLLGLAAHRRSRSLTPPRLAPAAQVFFCIDEREESMRRALEEVDPRIETFGAAGFFGVAVDYKGIDDARGVALCPVVVKPQHAVREKPTSEDSHLHEKREGRRRVWARLLRNASIGSRSLVRGALSTAVLGTLSAVPLITRVLAPRQYGKLRDTLNRAFLPEPRTELVLMRDDARFHEAVEGMLLGFAETEKADRVASVLGPVGLTKNFARLVVLLGHGSTSLNNPHESAYDCGACGGRRGGPNARIFAQMANRPAIREALAARGIDIPATTWFIGGDHDTCSDAIELFDLNEVPASHQRDLATLRASLDLARAANARERARRFESCPTTVSPAQALHHVEERSEHLAQPRQECGHATNAVCVVGRRKVTRGLFLDRRAFLVSYDPLHDTEAQNLGRLLGAVVPVCAGINLEYYFSSVDNQRYGCGSKLPHNVTGLIGVMDGQGSDLRTGLPLQMVEIHEPVRILFVIEATIEALEKVLSTNAAVNEFVANRWIRVAVMHPETGRIQLRRDHGYEDLDGVPAPLPTVGSSHEWYSGHLDHLPLAVIRGDA